jgi:DNA-binding transcriptional MerR regulator
MKNTRTPTPERRAILEDLKWALATRGSYQQQLLPFIGGVLRQCRDLDLSPADIEQIVENWQRDQDPHASDDESRVLEMFHNRIVDMCLKLREHRLENVQAVLSEKCAELAEARRDENYLAVSEKQIRTACRALDDRTQVVAGIFLYMGSFGRFNTISYWDDICERLADPEFLEKKAAAFADDPQIGVLVKAFRMGETVSAVDM